MRQRRPQSAGTVTVSSPTDDGLNGKLTAKSNLVSMRRVCVTSCRELSLSWILRIKLTGTLSSNSFTGVYKFKILIIYNIKNNNNSVSFNENEFIYQWIYLSMWENTILQVIYTRTKYFKSLIISVWLFYNIYYTHILV